MTSPGPVTPDSSDERLYVAFENAYWTGAVLEDHRISEDRVRAGVHAVEAQLRKDIAFDIEMYRGPINTVSDPTWWAGYGTAQTTAARIARGGTT